jgi:hypothetical protein
VNISVCMYVGTDSDYFIIAFPLCFLYQQISLWFLCLKQRFIYYGQLHVSANICICEIWQAERIFCVKFTFIFNVLYNCLLKVQIEAEVCSQDKINIPLFRLKIVTLTVADGATQIRFSTILTRFSVSFPRFYTKCSVTTQSRICTLHVSRNPTKINSKTFAYIKHSRWNKILCHNVAL